MDHYIDVDARGLLNLFFMHIIPGSTTLLRIISIRHLQMHTIDRISSKQCTKRCIFHCYISYEMKWNEMTRMGPDTELSKGCWVGCWNRDNTLQMKVITYSYWFLMIGTNNILWNFKILHTHSLHSKKNSRIITFKYFLFGFRSIRWFSQKYSDLIDTEIEWTGISRNQNQRRKNQAFHWTGCVYFSFSLWFVVFVSLFEVWAGK